MSTTYYRIIATSKSLNESIQEVDLTEQPTTNAQYAQQRADSLAARLNRDGHMRVYDWYGHVQANVVND